MRESLMMPVISVYAVVFLSLVLFGPTSSTAQTLDSTDRGDMIAHDYIAAN